MKRLILSPIFLLISSCSTGMNYAASTSSSPVETGPKTYFSKEIDPITDQLGISFGIYSNEGTENVLNVSCFIGGNKKENRAKIAIITNDSIQARGYSDYTKVVYRIDAHEAQEHSALLIDMYPPQGFFLTDGNRIRAKVTKEATNLWFRAIYLSSKIVIRYPLVLGGTNTVSFDLNKMNELLDKGKAAGCPISY